MADRVMIGLDNPAFKGRLRRPATPGHVSRSGVPLGTSRPVAARHSQRPQATSMPPAPREMIQPQNDVPVSPAPQTILHPSQQTATLPVVAPQPFVQPAQPRQQHSSVLKRHAVDVPRQGHERLSYKPRKYTRLQLSLVGMAGLVFIVGLAVSIQTVMTNHATAAQVQALAKRSSSSTNAVVPNATRLSPPQLAAYTVGPDDPRYLKIPEIDVDARVMQVGLTKTGALGTPSNVFDTAWYTGSAKPGQPGATLIDGHVSSWTTHGVFYNLKDLTVGNLIQIQRGDDTLINYKVVKTQVYGANNVDMQAAMTPITPGVPGLNLITCTGQVEKGTSMYNQRLVVFAQQVPVVSN